jgi:transcriptional regulator with XRE-family HTH domain
MTIEIKTGTDVLRAAVHARNKGTNLAGMARDLGLSASNLEAFAAGKSNLPPAMLKKLCDWLFAGNTEYDETIDRLRPTNKAEAKPLGIRPPPIDPATLPKYAGGPPTLYPPKKDQPKAPPPGWSS